ncbi:hypothetical protein [Mycoplasmopsis columbina]|uniref:Lipoprotein n=1 Tax=Mycoplasmopsis columbina SF7 TaxID=1037410 RepID=F9UJM5_9BACT|nr:hypothetical protein [Mycoplasmopsis columbina]EGV00406.1 hypothetical protein MCSF7_00356 [Mycoplasmopsis columbina SF7]VEU76729.1 Uncharacterised protein [Mycoplasmopsis columbina]
MKFKKLLKPALATSTILTVIPVAVACASKEEKAAQYEKEYKIALKNQDAHKLQEIGFKILEIYKDDPNGAAILIQKWTNEVIYDNSSSSN